MPTRRAGRSDLRRRALQFHQPIHGAGPLFLSNPHFAKSALARYTQDDFAALVARHGIASHEKTLGQLFCDGSARAIVAMLLAECGRGRRGSASGPQDHRAGPGGPVPRRHRPRPLHRRSTDLATGGLSIPKLGATGFAYDAARQFGLPLTEIRPALVPLVANDDDLVLMRPLSGVSLPVEATCGRTRFREAMLFTHRGLSGPAILQISSAWREGRRSPWTCCGCGCWGTAPGAEDPAAKARLRTILGTLLPQRLADALAARGPDGPIADMRDRELMRLAAELKAWTVQPHGSEGYAKAEVTLGGVATSALSSKTMQATAVPGLFVIGEAVDVTGWLGGYNFQWAWSSGWCAGMAA